jgi:hypothetical protein
MASSKKPVIVYGASGYTGMLIIEQLIELEIPFIAAGRNAEKIRANMADRVAGLENADYDVLEVNHDVDALTDLFSGARVVCNTVGPFLKYYREVVQACLNASCHYQDTTGEQAYTLQVEQEFGEAFAGKELVLAPATSYMYVPLHIAAELCLEQGEIDTLECASVPTVMPTVGSANTIMMLLLEKALYLKDNQMVEWSLGDSREVITPGFATTNLGLPWGGTQIPQYYQHDHRVRNCSALIGFPNRDLMSGLVKQAIQMKEEVEGKSQKERHAILDDFARGLSPGMPPREKAAVNRNIDHVVGRGNLKEVSATLIGIYPYITTAAIQAYGARRLLSDSHNCVGFTSACKAYGHREILGFLEDRGLVSHRISA